MDAYDRWTNLWKKNIADIVAIYGRGRELFRPPTYVMYRVSMKYFPDYKPLLQKKKNYLKYKLFCFQM
jgi:hypothetical protein